MITFEFIFIRATVNQYIDIYLEYIYSIPLYEFTPLSTWHHFKLFNDHFIEQMTTKNIEDNQYMKEDSVLPSYVLSSCYIIILYYTDVSVK